MSKASFHFEIIPGRFFYTSLEEEVHNNQKALFFNLDDSVKYVPFNEDFGPLNIQKIFAYVD